MAVSIPTTVESIREKAFYGCKSLRSIILPEGVKRIWKWAFAECTLLHSVSFPNTLVAISPGAFNGCTSLEAVNVSPKTSFSNVDYAASFPSTTNVYQRSKGKRGRGDDEGAGPQQHTKGSLVDWTAPTHAKPANRTSLAKPARILRACLIPTWPFRCGCSTPSATKEKPAAPEPHTPYSCEILQCQKDGFFPWQWFQLHFGT